MDSKLPNNWVKANLGDILKLKNGYAFKSKNYLENGIPVIRISEIKNEYISLDKAVYVDESEFLENFIIKEGDILIAMSGATTGKYGIYDKKIKAYQNQRVGNLRPYSNKHINKKYVYYLIGKLKKEIEEKAYGGAQPNISSKLIENTSFNLAPLKEQRRIVEKLDLLFSELDDVKLRLEKIPELVKTFRQAVLSKAITGKLTKKWRGGNELKDWQNTTIGEMFTVKTGSTPKRGTSKYYDNANIPWLKSGQVKNELIFEAEEFITEIAVKETNAKVYPKETLLVAMYGEGKTRGQVGWMKFEAASNQAIAALVNEKLDEITRSYVFYFCLSQYNEIRAQAEGGNQPNLNLTKIKNWKISIPPLEEQKVIVSSIKNLFFKAGLIEKQYKVLKEKVDSLPQSILNKTFKGKLVEQLPTDGNARDLLDEIKELKEEASLKVKKKSNKNAKRGISKEQKINKLKAEIKNILIDNQKGITFNELIEKFNKNEDSNLVSIVIEKLISNKSITQYFNSDKKEMRIKINL